MGTEFQIDGMTCGNCARHVTDAIQSVPEVRSATVSLERNRATIRWNNSENVPAVLKAVQKAGYAAHEAGDMAQTGRTHWQWALWTGIVITAILMTGEWVFGLEKVRWFRLASFVLAGIVQIYSGAQFYRGAWRQLKIASSNMDTLVALGSTAAFAYSTWALFSGPGRHLYFMEAAAIITIVSLGHWIEARVSEKAGSAMRSLLNLAPQTAQLLFRQPERIHEVLVSQLQTNDEVLLRPGDRIPVDGIVTEGDSTVDESALTGESRPAEKNPGKELFAGTVNLNGLLVMRVTATGEETALAHIVAAVQRAQTSRADIQRLGDRVSAVFVPVIVLIALVAGFWWGLAPASAHAVHHFLGHVLWYSNIPAGAAAGVIIATAVLIVACPCAMGLATPAAIMAAANAAARRGILIRDGVALEKAGRITALVFDKTGTLTAGKPEIASVLEMQQARFKPQSLAANLARNSSHPLSQALAVQSAETIELDSWREVGGSGIEASVRHIPGQVRLGSLRWLAANGIDLSRADEFISKWTALGSNIIGLAVERNPLALFAMLDGLKPDAPGVVKQLRGQGLKIYMVTGDNSRTAASIAAQAGIPDDHVLAEVQPAQKADFVTKLQAKGERVAFIGDGINDAPALAQANLGIAVSRASDIARESADIVLLKSEITGVPEALALARATLRTIKQNLFWAFFYNSIGVPLASLGFVSPVFCAVAMGVSDLVVIGNALRLLRRKL
ncbi:MAG TPA: cation-translocating P-type ATPase [Verrucomicrobiae bacterium]|jgi:Cu+-exporting ATPase|nr:cation-translocating P-type ATPase [Verrucomicrobiae bacterium]